MKLYGSLGRTLDLLFISVRQALFAELRKASIRFFRSVCLSVRPLEKKLVSHSTDFHEIRHVNIFQKALSKKKFKISLKCVNNSGYCT
jgi:hypothetical protein